MRIALTAGLVGAIFMAALLCPMLYGHMAKAQAISDDYGLAYHSYRLPAGQGSARQVHTMTIDELVDLVKSNRSYVIVDTRPRVDYDKAHLPGAVSIPLNLTDSYAGKLDKSRLIVTYCGSSECPESTRSAQEFMRLGFTNIRDYKGGLKEWKDRGYPVYGTG